jgi:hypothetical protein
MSVNEQRSSICFLDRARRNGGRNASPVCVAVDRVIAFVGAGSTLCVAGMVVRFAASAPGGVAHAESSRRSAGLRRRARQRRSPIPARTRGPVVPDARDCARTRASSHQLPRVRQAVRSSSPRPRMSHPCARLMFVVPAPSANKDMSLTECQKCWCVIESLRGHSAGYA